MDNVWYERLHDVVLRHACFHVMHEEEGGEVLLTKGFLHSHFNQLVYCACRHLLRRTIECARASVGGPSLRSDLHVRRPATDEHRLLVRDQRREQPPDVRLLLPAERLSGGRQRAVREPDGRAGVTAVRLFRIKSEAVAAQRSFIPFCPKLRSGTPAIRGFTFWSTLHRRTSSERKYLKVCSEEEESTRL